MHQSTSECGDFSDWCCICDAYKHGQVTADCQTLT